MPAWRIAGAALFVLVVVGLVHWADVPEHLRRAQGWMEGLGAWGPIVFIAIYVATTLVAGPGLPFTLISPVLFGPLPSPSFASTLPREFPTVLTAPRTALGEVPVFFAS